MLQIPQQLVLQSASTGIRSQRPVTTLNVQEVVATANQIRGQQGSHIMTAGSTSSTIGGQTVVTVGNLTGKFSLMLHFLRFIPSTASANLHAIFGFITFIDSRYFLQFF